MEYTGNIILVGPMGAGKTTIGRKLAKSLGLTFEDSDHVIEERTGADIPWIFDIEGEAGFRRREAAVIQELTKQQGLVLATGGGAVLDSKNRAAMTKSGMVVYLRVSIEQLLKRTKKDRHRPLLLTDNVQERLEKMMAEREPLYTEVADMVVDTDNRSVPNTVRMITNNIKKYSARPVEPKKKKPIEKKANAKEKPKEKKAHEDTSSQSG